MDLAEQKRMEIERDPLGYLIQLSIEAVARDIMRRESQTKHEPEGEACREVRV